MIETVGFAAISYRGKIYTGVRHLDIISNQIWPEYGCFPPKDTEGFLTSTGRFVGRAEAARIAFAAGQIISELAILYSEDIY